MEATFEGQTVQWTGQTIGACHELVGLCDDQARRLAPSFARDCMETGCTNYTQLDQAGPRQRQAYALIARAYAWNKLAGMLEEAREEGRLVQEHGRAFLF